MTPDPEDDVLKMIKLKVTAKGNAFTVQAIPFDPIDLKGFDSDGASEILSFKDDGLASGRAGVGFARQGAAANDTVTDYIPVGSGALFRDVTVTVGNKVVFEDSWDGHDSQTLLPKGWTDPAEGGAMAGAWLSSAHGGFFQMKDVYTASPTNKSVLKADGEGALFIGPAIEDRTTCSSLASSHSSPGTISPPSTGWASFTTTRTRTTSPGSSSSIPRI